MKQFRQHFPTAARLPLTRLAQRAGKYGGFALAVIYSLGKAWFIKMGRDLSRVCLPLAERSMTLPLADQLFIVNFTDATVSRLGARTGRKCFLRAFILARIFRRQGITVEFNVGLEAASAGQMGGQPDGHCWLTLQDHPIFETGNPQARYAHFLATGSNGIRYWLASGGQAGPTHD